MSADDRLVSARGVTVTRNPLQRPGQPEVLRKVQFPDRAGDRRLYIDVAALEQMLAMARASVTHRVVLHGVTVEVELVRSKLDGHEYEVWTFNGQAAPEGATLDDAMKGRHGG